VGASRTRRHIIRQQTIARRALPWLAVLGTVALTAECADPAHAAEPVRPRVYPAASAPRPPLLPWPRELPDLPDDYPEWARDEILWLIDDAATSFGVSRALMHDIAWAESKYDPDAYNRKSGAAGVYQFIRTTWEAAREPAMNGLYRGSSPYFPPANIYVAAWVMSQPYPWGPRHWGRR
jgi:soluble lytic murein transglycosylase-like protein